MFWSERLWVGCHLSSFSTCLCLSMGVGLYDLQRSLPTSSTGYRYLLYLLLKTAEYSTNLREKHSAQKLIYMPIELRSPAGHLGAKCKTMKMTKNRTKSMSSWCALLHILGIHFPFSFCLLCAAPHSLPPPSLQLWSSSHFWCPVGPHHSPPSLHSSLRWNVLQCSAC